MGLPATSRTSSTTGACEVAICGNPNSGKTTIFNAITGLNQKVANYPGVTVEKVIGRFSVGKEDPQQFTLVDVPGTYSLAAFSPDEYIAISALSGGPDGKQIPDAIICVIDATNLRRGLYLLFQILEIGRPVIVALNMIDLAVRRGMQIDFEKLSQAIGGSPVVPVVGNRGQGIDYLKQETARMVAASLHITPDRLYDGVTEGTLAELESRFSLGHRTRAEYLRIIFDVDGPAEKQFIQREGPEASNALKRGRATIRETWVSLSAAETTPLTRKAAQVFTSTVTIDRSRQRMLSEKVDRYLLHRLLGPAVLLLIMALMFQSIFSWAQPFMEMIDKMFTGLAGWVATLMPEGPMQSLIADGVIGGVGSVLVFIPQIAILFVFIAVLEDSGYMSRGAFLVDRMFRWCGLSGKSFIPMLSSFACAVPGIMATRTIEDRKLRFITIMVAPLMTCSARLPVYAIMIAAFVPYRSYFGVFNLQGIVLMLLYLLGVIVAVAVSFIMSRTFLRTERSTFLMEMPSYKMPTLRSVTIRVLNRVKSFIVRAGTIILAITIIIWALSYYPRSQAVGAEFDRQVEALEAHYDFAMITVQARLTELVHGQPEDVADPSGAISETFAQAQDEVRLSECKALLLADYPAHEALVETLSGLRLLEIQLQKEQLALGNKRAGKRLRDSYMGRLGRMVEPAFRPLGWDWKITMATLASFPAREVIIATLGTIYNLGAGADAESASLVDKMRQAKWEDGPNMGKPVFTLAVALSIMVFFAICCQCGATVVTIKQETASWYYAVFAFGYMTVLAYLLALAVYQLFAGMGF
jgi:ferrous iron transport protein B